MADKLYTDETITVTFEMWDGSLSQTKPEYRPHSAWLTAAAISQITLTISKPTPTVDQVKTLAGGGITASGRAGEWKATFDTDGGVGRYWIDWRATTTAGYSAVSVSSVTAKRRPA